MRVIRGVAGLGVVVLLALGGALPAYGGGPTSVLLVSPENETAAALYTSSSTYQALQRYVDEAGQKVEVLKPEQPSGHESGNVVRLTWLIHDTTVWRTDWIYTEATGGPWIATRLTQDDGNLWDQPVRWHAAAEPKALLALFGELGLFKKSADGGYPIQTPAVPQPEQQPVAAVQDESMLPGWTWVLPGLAAGAALMLLTIKLIPVWQRRDRDPRVQLVD